MRKIRGIAPQFDTLHVPSPFFRRLQEVAIRAADFEQVSSYSAKLFQQIKPLLLSRNRILIPARIISVVVIVEVSQFSFRGLWVQEHETAVSAAHITPA